PRRDDPPDRPLYRAQHLHAVNASGGVLQAIIVFLSCRRSLLGVPARSRPSPGLVVANDLSGTAGAEPLLHRPRPNLFSTNGCAFSKREFEKVTELRFVAPTAALAAAV